MIARLTRVGLSLLAAMGVAQAQGAFAPAPVNPQALHGAPIGPRHPALARAEGLRMGAVVDDTAAVQQDLDHCYATGLNCALDYHNTSKVITHALIVVPGLVSIRHVSFDCTNLSPGAICLNVTLDGYDAGTYTQRFAQHMLEDVRIDGNAGATGVRENYDNPTNYTWDAAIMFRSVEISNFGTAVDLGNNCWGGSFYNTNLHNNTIAIYTEPNVYNSGEKFVYVGGAVYNNGTGLDELSAFEFDFEGTSFDFNTTHMVLESNVDFTGHIENAAQAAPVVVLGALPNVGAASLMISAGSSITVDGYNPASPPGACWATTAVWYNAIRFPFSTWGVNGTTGPVCGPAFSNGVGTQNGIYDWRGEVMTKAMAR